MVGIHKIVIGLIVDKTYIGIEMVIIFAYIVDGILSIKLILVIHRVSNVSNTIVDAIRYYIGCYVRWANQLGIIDSDEVEQVIKALDPQILYDEIFGVE